MLSIYVFTSTHFFNCWRLIEGKPPRFPKKPTIHQDGDVLVMECLLEADPVPEITWFQGSNVILDTDRIRMSKKATGKDQYLLKLEISKPTTQDGGNYRCNACNSHGESNANIALNFQGNRLPLIRSILLYFIQPFNGMRVSRKSSLVSGCRNKVAKVVPENEK